MQDKCGYGSYVIIAILSAIIIILGIAYNSLRNENLELGSALSVLESDMCEDHEDMNKIAFRIDNLEMEVFKGLKRK